MVRYAVMSCVARDLVMKFSIRVHARKWTIKLILIHIGVLYPLFHQTLVLHCPPSAYDAYDSPIHQNYVKETLVPGRSITWV
jgi:hypothetical protein